MVFEVIDIRSFSSIWYWIALAVLWSTTSHWVLGVPYDMVVRARRHGGQAEVDLQDIVRINSNRLLYIARVAGLWLLGFVCFVMTTLGILAFYYWIEFAQALFMLAFPMIFVGLLSLLTARRMQNEAPTGKALRGRMMIHRITTQIIGMFAIFGTAMFGMYQNLSIGAFGQ